MWVSHRQGRQFGGGYMKREQLPSIPGPKEDEGGGTRKGGQLPSYFLPGKQSLHRGSQKSLTSKNFLKGFRVHDSQESKLPLSLVPLPHPSLSPYYHLPLLGSARC